MTGGMWKSVQGGEGDTAVRERMEGISSTDGGGRQIYIR